MLYIYYLILLGNIKCLHVNIFIKLRKICILFIAFDLRILSSLVIEIIYIGFLCNF